MIVKGLIIGTAQKGLEQVTIVSQAQFWRFRKTSENRRQSKEFICKACASLEAVRRNLKE